MRIIGYGIAGPGEANRYMKATLDCFKRLCDEVIILCNNTDKAEHDLIDSYGFKRVSDRREWGRWQWKIKQDFIERDIKQVAQKGDMLVCLDMDEVLDKHLTREWIKAAPLDAYHVFVVDLWNEGYKPQSCFWNVRMWRWNGETKFKPKPVHCGLAPEWAYHYHRHAPFLLMHYGLKEKEARLRRVERYKKYDPHAEHLSKDFYDMLNEDTCKPFDEDKLHDQIAKEVASYKQVKPREETMATPKKPRFGYVKNPHGEVIDIPERHVAETLKRKGFEWVGWADEQEKEIDALFESTEVGGDDTHNEMDTYDRSKGSYQRPAADEAAEVARRNEGSDITIKAAKAIPSKPLSYTPATNENTAVVSPEKDIKPLIKPLTAKPAAKKSKSSKK